MKMNHSGGKAWGGGGVQGFKSREGNKAFGRQRKNELGEISLVGGVKRKKTRLGKERWSESEKK